MRRREDKVSRLRQDSAVPGRLNRPTFSAYALACRGSSYDCPSTDRYVAAVLPSPLEIDMMAIGSFSKAFAEPPMRKVTMEIKEGA